MASASRWLDPYAVVPAATSIVATINPLEIRFIFTLSPANVAIGNFVMCDIALHPEPAAAGPAGWLVFVHQGYVAGQVTGLGYPKKIFTAGGWR